MITLLIIFALLGFIYFTASAILPEISKEQFRLVTDETVVRVEKQLSLVMHDIYSVSETIQRDERFKSHSEAELLGALQGVVDMSPFFDSGVLMDRQGNIVAFFPQDIRLFNINNLSEREYFRKAAETRQVYVSDASSEDTGQFVVNVSIPILTGPEVERVVNFTLDIEKNQLFQSIFQSVSIGNNGYTYIVDRQGRIIAHQNQDRIGENVSQNPVVKKIISEQKSGYQEVINTKGVPMYASYQFVPTLEWGLVAQVPVEETYSAFYAFLQSISMFSLVIIISLSVLTAVYARQIIRPIQKLYHAVDQVARGDYEQKIEKLDKSEVGQLSSRFNEMIGYIRNARLGLQRKEEELRHQKDFLRTVIDLNPNFIYAKNLSGNFTLVNRSFAEVFGMTTEQLIGNPVTSLNLVHNEAEDKQLIEDKQGKFIYEESFIDSSGHLRWVQTAKLPILSTQTNEGQVLFVSMDITERKNTEDYLRKSEKLSVVGELAAGVAHEIRNPLTSIKGFIQLLKSKSNEDSFYHEIMLSEIERINYIVSEFLVLAKPQVVHFEERQLHKLLQSVTTLLGTQAIIKNIEIVSDISDDMPPIYCEDNQLKQVFINVIKNAIEAMPNGGQITVIAKKHGQDSVLIRFIDEGTGIPKERMEKLGEPFYTTKEKGTGLGLMVSFKIIEAHQGTIQFHSELGKGTTIDIILPLAGKKAS